MYWISSCLQMAKSSRSVLSVEVSQGFPHHNVTFYRDFIFWHISRRMLSWKICLR
jgi:hypothetical protein